MRRLLVLAAVALVAAAPPAAGYTVQALQVDAVVGPQRDVHCRLDADLYRPDGASAQQPVPAILATNGFGGDKTGFSTIGPAYAQRGYVFLAYSGLGFGNSGCKISLDDPDWDGRAGSRLISFLGRLPYVVKDRVAHDGRRLRADPRVGMLNGSYGGAVQMAVASVDARLDAIAPLDTWNDLSYSLAPNNTDIARGVTSRTPGVMKADWPAAFFAVGLAGARNGDPSRLGPCPGYVDQVCPGLSGALATGYPDAATIALLRHASVASYVGRVRIPTLLAQGEHDTLFGLQESLATYRALRAQHVPVRLLWESAGHSGGGLGTAEYDPARPEAAYQSRMELQWFDWYLKHRGRRPRQDFSYFRDWVPYRGDAAPAVASAPAYPVGADRIWYLSGDRALTANRTAVQAGEARMIAQPAPASTGGGIEDLGSFDAPATAVSYTSAPLADDTDVVGVPRLTVRFDAPAFARSQGIGPGGKLVVFVKLQDVDPVTGAAVLPANLVSAVRVADVTQPVSIALPGIVHRFARGHELRLTLATSDAAFRGNLVAGPVGIPVRPDGAAVLRLPTG